MRYILHGLVVSCNRAIPGLIAEEGLRGTDLRVYLGHSPFPPPDFSNCGRTGMAGWETWRRSSYYDASGEPLLGAHRRTDGSHYRITYREGIDFVINRGATEVWVTWLQSRTLHDVPTLLLGPIIGIVLRLRGITSLHASAVAVAGRAILFSGPQGAGKSTLAAGLASRGVPVLADDTVALRENGEGWVATAGYPRIRLWPASAHAVAGETGPSALLPPGPSGSTSRYHLDLTSARCRFQREPLPIGGVYVLEESEGVYMPSAQPLAPVRALMALVANTYSPRVLDRDGQAEEFRQLGRLVTHVPVWQLARSQNLERLPELCEFVLGHVTCNGLGDSQRS